MLALLDPAPPSQRRPILLLAAVHDLLLAGTDHPLADWYDTVATVRGVTPRQPRATSSRHSPTSVGPTAPLTALVRSRVTQTNEVGRCTALFPALCTLASQEPAGRPFSLLDLGCSAGLNLRFDRYAYTYRDRRARSCARPASQAPRSPWRAPCAAIPRHCRPCASPPSHARVGLDLTPLDPRVDDDARWLLACQWPDNPVRFGRLRAALAAARADAQPPRLEQGDMVEDLARVARTVPGGHPLVVFHSWVAAYLSEERQRALVDAVEDLGRTRPVHHLYCEAPFETPGLPTPPSPLRRDGPDLSTALVHIGPAGAAPVRLADTHPHGAWIRWWPALSGPAPRVRPGGPAPAPPRR